MSHKDLALDASLLSSKSYTPPNNITYSSINTFFRPTNNKTLPLIVFIHGLGGNLTQFVHLIHTPTLNTQKNYAVLAIDLPGCGASALEPQDWSAYSLPNLSLLTEHIITQHRNENQPVILIAHSLGSSIAALIASRSAPYISAFIAICPRSEPLTANQKSQLRYLAYLPVPLFDLYRFFDRRGGLQSASVERYVGAAADDATRRLQLAFNAQSRSGTVLRMLTALASEQGGLPGRDVWTSIEVPVLCIAGAADVICPPRNAELIREWWSGRRAEGQHEEGIPVAAGEVPDATHESGPNPGSESGDSRDAVIDTSTSGFHTFITLPAPAAHGLLYATATADITGEHIQAFLSTLP